MSKVSSYLKTFKFCFESKRDNHGSLHLQFPHNMEHNQFKQKLKNILREETESKSKAIWMFIDRQKIKFLEEAFQQGFKIHHAKQTQIVLYQWLNSSLSDLVPKFSRFYIASGGIIIHKGKLLMVQQSNGNRKNDWGIPGGLTDMNQPLQDATEREVMQETNLRVKFQYMVYFRQIDNTLFDGTDYYFANYVKLDQKSLRDFKLCQRELKGYEWVDLNNVDEFKSTHQIRNTQFQLLSYLGELYKSGFDFENQKPNRHRRFQISIANRRKQFREHRLIPIISKQ